MLSEESTLYYIKIKMSDLFLCKVKVSQYIANIEKVVLCFENILKINSMPFFA